ncbi:MAG: hypothetical protein K2X82_27815 [Gemmataceae bacterium]|nr:hypothetical protein [Gemmataceae bacterium]
MNDSSAQRLAALARSRDLFRAGQPLAAADVLRDLGAAVREAPEVAYLHALLWMEARGWPDALARLDELRAVAPPRLVLELDRAGCLIELGRDAEAERLIDADAPYYGGSFAGRVLLARVAARGGDAGRAAGLLGAAFDAERRRLLGGFFDRLLTPAGRT